MTVSPVAMGLKQVVTFVIPLVLTTVVGCGSRGGGTVGPPMEPTGPCIGTCVPDPGSRPPNCAAEQAGLEFLSVWNFDDIKEFDGVPQAYGRGLYAYTDKSTPNISPSGYEQPATPVERCGPTNAMHIHGGPFRGWGGGVGVSFKNIDRSRCEPGAAQPGDCRPIPGDFAGLTLDLNQWEGISLWARRGPNSQASVRVGMGDQNTDDDISFRTSLVPANPRNCERNRECSCPNQKPCSPYVVPGTTDLTYYCWDPADGTVPVTMADERTLATDKCGTSKCKDDYPAFPGEGDPSFNASACTPYSFNNGTGASYCFTPGKDHVPYDNTQTCGDHWVFPVTLTTDWHLYFVPFTVLQQQGFGKKFARPELAVASMLRLMWDVGWVDYWVDDVGFYRRVRN